MKNKKKKISVKEVDSCIVRPPTTEYLPTGFASLNYIIGGGWPKGKLVELWGVPSSGKTTFVLQEIGRLQKIGYNCCYIDAERRFDAGTAKLLGVDISKLIFMKPPYAEKALDELETLIRDKKVNFIVLDSIASFTPRQVMERGMDQQEQAALARLLSRALPKLEPLLDDYGCYFIMVNQIRYEVGKMFGDPKTTPGGEALKFNGFTRIELIKTETLKSGEELIGQVVRFYAKKNTACRSGGKTLLTLDYGKGFNYGLDKIQMMIKNGEITTAGAYYYYKDKQYKGMAELLKGLGEKE